MSTGDTIVFKPAFKLVTKDKGASYRVLSGHVLVFLQAVSGRAMERQILVTEAAEGQIIPSVLQTVEGRGDPVTVYLVLSSIDGARVERVAASLDHAVHMAEKIDGGSDLVGSLLAMRERDWADARMRIGAARERGARKRWRNVQAIVSSLGGGEGAHGQDEPTGNDAYDALSALCRRRGIDVCPIEKVREACGAHFSLEDAARISGFVCRQVSLPEKRACEMGPFVARTCDDGRYFVCRATRGGAIGVVDPGPDAPKTLERSRVESVWVVHRTFGPGKVGLREAIRFSLREFTPRDLARTLVCMALVTILGVQMSTLSALIYDAVIPQGEASMLVGIGVLFVALMLASLCFSIVQSRAAFRLTSRVKYAIQTAIYQRILHLPESYVRNRESAELSYRASILSSTYMTFFSSAVGIVLQVVFGTFYLVKMVSYSWVLSLVGVAFTFINIAVTVIVGFYFRKFQSRRSQMTGKMRSFIFQAINGISSIRVAGAEPDVVRSYLDLLARMGGNDYNYALAQRLSVLLGSLTSAGCIIVFYAVVGGGSVGISMGDFMGFVTAYSMLSATMVQVASSAMNAVAMMPMLRDSMEILRPTPEMSGEGCYLCDFSGEVDVANLSFAYGKGAAPILRDVSFHIDPGEYVAFVGASGCGKSTLLRLLLGFESPRSGVIRYDGVNFSQVNKPEFRRNVGVVLQDGALFSGTIYKNVKAAHPLATQGDIEAALGAVGLTEDIARMPMGLNTLVSEQVATVSGGQKQRIMIARAIVGGPRMLFLDEATSSLDNVSQAKVVQSLDDLSVTRIVVAHRLSTVKRCDRIFVLDKGTIAEVGTFDELMARRGCFYELARRQLF